MRDMLSLCWSSTHFAARRRSVVQRAQPSGGLPQASATILTSSSPVAFGCAGGASRFFLCRNSGVPGKRPSPWLRHGGSPRGASPRPPVSPASCLQPVEAENYFRAVDWPDAARPRGAEPFQFRPLLCRQFNAFPWKHELVPAVFLPLPRRCGFRSWGCRSPVLSGKASSRIRGCPPPRPRPSWASKTRPPLCGWQSSRGSCLSCRGNTGGFWRRWCQFLSWSRCGWTFQATRLRWRPRRRPALRNFLPAFFEELHQRKRPSRGGGLGFGYRWRASSSRKSWKLLCFHSRHTLGGRPNEDLEGLGIGPLWG